MASPRHLSRLGLHSRLVAAIGLAIGTAVVEIVGSWLSGSLALLSDAGHVGTDAVALSLSLWALRVSDRPHTPRLSFGYHRTEVLAAVANAGLLLVLAGFLLWRSYVRLLSPDPVEGGIMLSIGLVGLGANLVMVALLRDWSRRNINARGAFLHAYGDALGSAGVVMAAFVIQATGFYAADILAALFIVGLIVLSAVRLMREGSRILLEGSPAQVRPEEVAEAIGSTPGVLGVHDLHIWTVTSDLHVLTGHITVSGDTTVHESSRMVDGIQETLRERFGITHATLQVDSVQDELIRPSEVQAKGRT